MLLQKSRLKWDNEGDMNNRFFHSVMKDRRKKNFIGSIQFENGLIKGVEEIKNEIFRFFVDYFSETDQCRPILDNVPLNCLSGDDNNLLEAKFTELDIKEDFWECEGLKSPGPDEYNSFFLRKC
ncbi:unnamed protein product [Lathyrus sativus]|nr:unnamed protein product [Lathyrus sativus]